MKGHSCTVKYVKSLGEDQFGKLLICVAGGNTLAVKVMAVVYTALSNSHPVFGKQETLTFRL